VFRGEEKEKKKKTNKKRVYDYSYMHFQSQKKKKNIKNMHTIARTCVSGPGVLEKVDECWKHVAGGGKTWLDGQKAWRGVETCSWGLANDNNRANK
jgi:N-acetyl-anhydromuramyl-L-alanine amidase AmpD